jgi:hypothetical protein
LHFASTLQRRSAAERAAASRPASSSVEGFETNQASNNRSTLNIGVV